MFPHSTSSAPPLPATHTTTTTPIHTPTSASTSSSTSTSTSTSSSTSSSSSYPLSHSLSHLHARSPSTAATTTPNAITVIPSGPNSGSGSSSSATPPAPLDFHSSNTTSSRSNILNHSLHLPHTLSRGDFGGLGSLHSVPTATPSNVTTTSSSTSTSSSSAAGIRSGLGTLTSGSLSEVASTPSSPSARVRVDSFQNHHHHSHSEQQQQHPLPLRRGGGVAPTSVNSHSQQPAAQQMLIGSTPSYYDPEHAMRPPQAAVGYEQFMQSRSQQQSYDANPYGEHGATYSYSGMNGMAVAGMPAFDGMGALGGMNTLGGVMGMEYYDTAPYGMQHQQQQQQQQQHGLDTSRPPSSFSSYHQQQYQTSPSPDVYAYYSHAQSQPSDFPSNTHLSNGAHSHPHPQSQSHAHAHAHTPHTHAQQGQSQQGQMAHTPTTSGRTQDRNQNGTTSASGSGIGVSNPGANSGGGASAAWTTTGTGARSVPVPLNANDVSVSAGMKRARVTPTNIDIGNQSQSQSVSTTSSLQPSGSTQPSASSSMLPSSSTSSSTTKTTTTTTTTTASSRPKHIPPPLTSTSKPSNTRTQPSTSRKKQRTAPALTTAEDDSNEDDSDDEVPFSFGASTCSGVNAATTVRTNSNVAPTFGHHYSMLPPLGVGMGVNLGSGASRGSGSGSGMGTGTGATTYLGSGQQARLPGACTHCKKLKMKCEFPKNENRCKRCKTGGHDCIVEGRKPRSAPNKREYLLLQIRQKDAIIESLLKQIHNPYTATPLAIDAFKMASSPSDTAGGANVTQWLERLQHSANTAGPAGGINRPFNFDFKSRHPEAIPSVEADSENESGDGPSSADVNVKTEDSKEVSETVRVDDSVPISLLAEMSLENRPSRSKSGSHSGSHHGDSADDDSNLGVANDAYFMKGPMSDLNERKKLIEGHMPPEILVHGLVTEEDVKKLFEIFYEHINPFLSLLDPVLHTPASTFARCPFLFTVICAISSRYYREKSEIYAIAMHFAKHAASTALIDGWKSVELCQAYILMGVYAVPARRWEEDRSWLYIGLAIRLATDLNLHQPSSQRPTSELQEREQLNRSRVWMICFNLDRSTATQFGKPSTIKEDFMIRNSSDWYKKSKYNHKYDLHLCAYSALLRVVAKFHGDIYSDTNSPSGLNQNVDFRAITQDHDEKLEEFYTEWSERFRNESDPNDNGCNFRCSLLPFLVNYSRLVMFSFGFQQAFRRGLQPGDRDFLEKCLTSASEVIKCVINSLAPSGYFRYAPDGHFVFASFASAFLLKLLRQDGLLEQNQITDILGLIGRLIQVLASSEVSIDDRHTPKLYARFLASLLAKYHPSGSSSGRLVPRPPPEGHVPDSDSHGQFAPGGGAGASGGVGIGGSSGLFQVQYGSGGSPSTRSSSQRPLGTPQFVMSGPDTPSIESTSTPIYEAEATYAVGTGPLELSSSDAAMSFMGDGGGEIMEQDLLATMHTLKNPVFWDNMMMPGFSWPEMVKPYPAPYPSMDAFGINGASFGSGMMMQTTPLQS